MLRRLLVAALLVFAILGALSGAEARGHRQSCVTYTVGVWTWAITTPEECVPCIWGQPMCAPPPRVEVVSAGLRIPPVG
jgi:hypothetical protein